MSEVYEIVGNFKAGGVNYKPNKPGEAVKTITGLDEQVRNTLLAKGRIKPYQAPPAPLPPENVNAGQTGSNDQPPAEPPQPPAPQQPPAAPQPPAEPVTPPANPTADDIANDPALQ